MISCRQNSSERRWGGIGWRGGWCSIPFKGRTTFKDADEMIRGDVFLHPQAERARAREIGHELTDHLQDLVAVLELRTAALGEEPDQEGLEVAAVEPLRAGVAQHLLALLDDAGEAAKHGADLVGGAQVLFVRHRAAQGKEVVLEQLK